MTKDVILGFIRHILTFGGGYLASSGFLASSDVDLAVGAIVTLIGVGWSALHKKQVADATAAPGV